MKRSKLRLPPNSTAPYLDWFFSLAKYEASIGVLALKQRVRSQNILKSQMMARRAEVEIMLFYRCSLLLFSWYLSFEIDRFTKKMLNRLYERHILGRTTFWSPKSQCVYGPENEIAAVTFFAKNGAALTKSNTLASVTEWQDSGEHGCWLKVSSPACMLPIFAKAPCCLELFGCCCRRLSQHGVGEVLILLRHCLRDASFCVCVGSGSFCHDWASHCSVLFWSLDALFVFGLPPFAPLDS